MMIVGQFVWPKDSGPEALEKAFHVLVCIFAHFVSVFHCLHAHTHTGNSGGRFSPFLPLLGATVGASLASSVASEGEESVTSLAASGASYHGRDP